MNLELFGQRFTVISDNDEARIRDIVDFVNRRLEEVRDSSKRVQADQIALLAALNIAEELFEEREKMRQLRRRVRERSLHLLNTIDAIAEHVDLPVTEALMSEAIMNDPATGEPIASESITGEPFPAGLNSDLP